MKIGNENIYFLAAASFMSYLVLLVKRCFVVAVRDDAKVEALGFLRNCGDSYEVKVTSRKASFY